MTREELDRAVRLAVDERADRIRREWRRLPKKFAPLAQVIAERFHEPAFDVKTARTRSGVRRGTPPLGKTLIAYIAECRVRTALRILELGGGRIPTGRAAAAVGLGAYKTWRGTVAAVTGEVPPLVRAPEPLALRFDELSWHRACRRGLSLDEVLTLLERLRRLYPGALDGATPNLRSLPWLPSAPAPRGGGISHAAAEKARERAAKAPRRRLRDAARDLPRDVQRTLEDAADHLFDSDLDGATSRRRLEIRDHGITSKVRFFLGDSLGDTIERGRIETALPLVADLRFTLTGVAEVLGLSLKRFTAAFLRRTGVEPSAVRATAAATSRHAARRLWHRAESGKLTRAEVRFVAGCLRGLQSEAFPGAARTLAVRRDVDPGRIDSVLRLTRVVPPRSQESVDFDEMVTTHPRYSADRWYVHWIRARLGRESLASAWAEWRWADRRLAQLLQLSPDERLDHVRRDPDCRTEAFLWLLIDCVGARLFHDAAESEHFADLAVAAAEARCARDESPEAAALRALAVAFKGNALRRRNVLDESAEKLGESLKVVEDPKADPWIAGRIYSLHASLLDQRGEEQEAFQTLSDAASCFKDAKDEVERVRCVLCRSFIWFAKGHDPSRLLTACIRALEGYPFATDLLAATHLNRILASIYLADRLTGSRLATIKRLREAMPPPPSAYAAAQYQKVDGLIGAMGDQPEVAAASLERAASWFEEHDLLADAAVCWLQYSWAALAIDTSVAERAATTAYAYMERTGFRSHGLREAALKIKQDAQQGNLRRGLLRRGILLMVCPPTRGSAYVRGQASLAEAPIRSDQRKAQSQP